MWKKIETIFNLVEEHLNSDESIGALKIKTLDMIEKCYNPNISNMRSTIEGILFNLIQREDTETKLEVTEDYFLFYRVFDIKAKTVKLK